MSGESVLKQRSRSIVMADSNWRQALDLRDLQTLSVIIDLVLEFEATTGRKISPLELLKALTCDTG